MVNSLIQKIKRLFRTDMSDVNNKLKIMSSHNILMDKKHDDPKSLMRYGNKVFSQGDEDGIIDEIFNRIGVEEKVFVEFGAGDGLENNTLNLLLQNWTGYWIEGAEDLHLGISKNFKHVIDNKSLVTLNKYITKDNVEQLFNDMGVPKKIDLLSIDIDSNDFWIWDSIKAFDANVVVIEYNAEFGSKINWRMKYDDDYSWNGSSCYGASLKALQKLGEEKGYRLVACNLYGINAFFVKEEHLKDLFVGDYSSEFHFMPPRYNLRPDRVREIDFNKLFLGMSKESN